MTQPKPELALRYRGGDKHHLFLNHGTWFLRYGVREAPWLKADRRICLSLGTKDLEVAKERRDAALSCARRHFEQDQRTAVCQHVADLNQAALR
jgi:hypothetical protein